MPGKRRSRHDCDPMPDVLSLCHVSGVYSWPLGQVMTRRAAGQGWTDCVLELDARIRLGGKYNSRRVRYNGRFYIVHNGRSVYLVGELAWQAWETVTHVYGIDAESDISHNVLLKGY